MKPPVCEVCGVRSRNEPPDHQGGYVTFSNFEPDAPIMIGHPTGWEFFCAQHLPAAQALSHLRSEEAIEQIRRATGLSPPIPVQGKMPPSLFQRLIQKIIG